MKHKVLTVKQPWAYLLCAGIKDIENRTWKLPEKYKGERVLIHASRSTTKNGRHNYSMFTESQLDAIRQEKYERDLRQLSLNVYSCPKYLCIANSVSSYSAIIGSVRFVDCVFDHPSIWAEKWVTKKWHNGVLGGTYDLQPYNWIVADPILFDKPILNVKGKLGFWDYDLPEEYEKLLK